MVVREPVVASCRVDVCVEMLGAKAGEVPSAGVLCGVDKRESFRPVSVTPDDGLDERLSESGTLMTLFLCVSGRPSTMDVGRAFRNPMLKALPGDDGGVGFFFNFVGVVG